MTKKLKLLLIILITIGLMTKPIIFVYAQETATTSNFQTNTSILQKALKSIEDLINIKDEEGESLAFRIKAFKQVIELAIAEAKNLKVKLISLEKLDEKELDWQNEQIEKLNTIIEFYEKEQKTLSEQKAVTLEWIKTKAQNFKEWREDNYFPVAEDINNFLLIQQQQKAIETAQERLKKINRDLQLFKKREIKNLKLLSDLFAKAELAITESIKLNKQATTAFWEDQKKSKLINNTTTTVSSTTTLSISSSINIRDLIKESLNKIKEAYQIFIEMSKLVK